MLTAQRKPVQDDFKKRLWLVAIGIVFGVTVLIGRLWYLQVLYGEYYAQEAESRRLHQLRVRAPRGRIFDRHGEQLFADNRQANDVVLVLAEAKGAGATVPAVCEKLAKLIGIDAVKAAEKVYYESITKKWGPYHQVVVKEDITHADLVQVEEYSAELPGVFAVMRPQRRYQYEGVAGQVLGYVGEVSWDEIDGSDGEYKLGDHLGRTGLEVMYEDVLRGTSGAMVVTRSAGPLPQMRTDRFGRALVTQKSTQLTQIANAGEQAALPGRDIRVSLDLELQAEAERLLREDAYIGGKDTKGPSGAIVVLDADSGEVLALASVPSYDPNAFVTKGRSAEIAAISNHPKAAMLHRAYRAPVAPGSVYKIAMAVAALEEGVITRDSTFYCPGFFKVSAGSRRFHCHQRNGHGSVNIIEALAWSCDVFFYNVGMKLGVERMNAWSLRMGMGNPTGIDLPGERGGLIPSKAWKKEIGQSLHPDDSTEWDWYPGETVIMAIGQGSVLTTTLQNAVMMAAVVNGGRVVKPRLNLEVPPGLSEPIASEATMDVVRAGLKMCVEKMTYRRGTGRRARVEGVEVIGKTGTAQVVRLELLKPYGSRPVITDIPEHLRHNAHFVAGTLDRSPRLAIAIFVEHGHEGGGTASPLAKNLIEFYYKKEGLLEPPAQVASLEGDS
jgi:penicillin-binding protein 2